MSAKKLAPSIEPCLLGFYSQEASGHVEYEALNTAPALGSVERLWIPVNPLITHPHEKEGESTKSDDNSSR